MNGAMKLLDETINILPAPVGAAERAPTIAIDLPRRLIRKIERLIYLQRIDHAGSRPGDRIRIKIIIEMHAVDVVAPHHIRNDGQRPLHRDRLARIQPPRFTVFFYRSGVRQRQMVRRKR